MDHKEMDNFFADDITSKKSSTKIDDMSNLKNASLDFLSNERNERFEEKFDAEKPKEEADDFLNFHDNVEETISQPQNPVPIPSIEQKDDDDEDESNTNQTEAEIDFHAIEDDYLNPYAPSTLSKGVSEPQNEKFISSEDLLTDFKDPHPAPPAEVEKVEPVKVVEAPKPIIEQQPPVVAAPVEPVKPVVVEEPPKPKSAPPPAPVKRETSNDTQIEAEKIFTSIGLG